VSALILMFHEQKNTTQLTQNNIVRQSSSSRLFKVTLRIRK